jgi:hypothetical protein
MSVRDVNIVYVFSFSAEQCGDSCGIPPLAQMLNRERNRKTGSIQRMAPTLEFEALMLSQVFTPQFLSGKCISEVF